MTPARRTAAARSIGRSIALAILFGVALTVASSWFCALNSRFPSEDSLVMRNVIMLLATNYDINPEGENPLLTPKDLEYHTETAPGIQRVSAYTEGLWMRIETLREAAGWPALALQHTTAFEGGDEFVRVDWGVPTSHLGITPDKLGHRLTALPYRPLWPGFALNVAVYSAVAWLALVVPGATRRTLRRGRGLCPHCAYDRRGLPDHASPCPECGATCHGATCHGLAARGQSVPHRS